MYLDPGNIVLEGLANLSWVSIVLMLELDYKSNIGKMICVA